MRRRKIKIVSLSSYTNQFAQIKEGKREGGGHRDLINHRAVYETGNELPKRIIPELRVRTLTVPAGWRCPDEITTNKGGSSGLDGWLQSRQARESMRTQQSRQRPFVAPL